MKPICTFALFVTLVLPMFAAGNSGSPKPGSSTQSSPKPTKGTPAQQATSTGGVTKPSPGTAPAPAAPATPAAEHVTLDAYMQELTSGLSLTKDEQTDIKTYYLDDGSKLNGIFNDASLSPFQQTRQVQDLRDARNAKIEALLRDVDRQQAFLKTEAGYRVALTELAADGGLVPTGPTPNVPQPTATSPAAAEKAPNAPSAP